MYNMQILENYILRLEHLAAIHNKDLQQKPYYLHKQFVDNFAKCVFWAR